MLIRSAGWLQALLSWVLAVLWAQTSMRSVHWRGRQSSQLGSRNEWWRAGSWGKEGGLVGKREPCRALPRTAVCLMSVTGMLRSQPRLVGGGSPRTQHKSYRVFRGKRLQQFPASSEALPPHPSLLTQSLMLTGSFAPAGFGSHTWKVAVPMLSSGKLWARVHCLIPAIGGALIVGAIC